MQSATEVLALLSSGKKSCKLMFVHFHSILRLSIKPDLERPALKFSLGKKHFEDFVAAYVEWQGNDAPMSVTASLLELNEAEPLTGLNSITHSYCIGMRDSLFDAICDYADSRGVNIDCGEIDEMFNELTECIPADELCWHALFRNVTQDFEHREKLELRIINEYSTAIRMLLAHRHLLFPQSDAADPGTGKKVGRDKRVQLLVEENLANLHALDFFVEAALDPKSLENEIGSNRMQEATREELRSELLSLYEASGPIDNELVKRASIFRLRYNHDPINFIGIQTATALEMVRRIAVELVGIINNLYLAPDDFNSVISEFSMDEFRKIDFKAEQELLLIRSQVSGQDPIDSPEVLDVQSIASHDTPERDKSAFPPDGWQEFKNRSALARWMGVHRSKVTRAFDKNETWLMESADGSTVAADLNHPTVKHRS